VIACEALPTLIACDALATLIVFEPLTEILCAAFATLIA
jgi:hypothetical protein